ncbi:hypothetical protein ZYGR_0P03280 [Zygosaccharomyces rouxii]|uniref:UDP-galactose transporter homolog 1 n=2 Tax=Zygosaccharomyces rouxii TaxID=4956 RepID=C5E4R1_ZYGRC|nr:uncharacterized protein ZYRO0E08096g [Zygosaccharomyces rouxii]KAH9198122.1 UAA transporter [Zygosaccharomyces rouxii]GAV49682.1 hypothetical protein ZYGR_0P03280 [Zygosaccharomyces rouxii]CAR31022.1 ZYRO0E08096p [Zygosaccharomyces rouxii]
MSGGVLALFICAAGIYSSFLTWALVQEPLTTKFWPNSQHQFQAPSVVAAVQAAVAMIVGLGYLKWKKCGYGPVNFVKDHGKSLAMISLSQSCSGPLATYSLQYVDFLTYMLAKSCKMLPVLLIHLLLYRTSISKEKRLVAVLVSLGVAVFSFGGSGGKQKTNGDDAFSLHGYALLVVSLFLDGVTNASQDKMLKANSRKDASKPITGAHMMFALNMFIVVWNLGYLFTFDRLQVDMAKFMLSLDGEIWKYLLTYAICGAVGQCFIFFTLEHYGSLALITITVTRKMISMVLSIFVFRKKVMPLQWIGIGIVFGGITWEAISKRRQAARIKKD